MSNNNKRTLAENGMTLVDVAGKTMDTANNTMGAIKWGAIAIVTVSVIGGGLFVYNKLANLGEFAIEAGGALVEAGTDGVSNAIEGAGENAAVIRESVGTAVDSALEGVDLPSGEAVTEGVDNATGWLADRVNNARDALGGDE